MSDAHRQLPVGTQRAARWARWCAALVLAFTVIVAGCDELGLWVEVVKFRFDNRTDSTLCKYPSVPDASAARCLAEIEPHATTGWGSECGDVDRDAARRAPITVVLTVKASGRQIYNRTASCREWNDSDRMFVIEQEGDEFVVTDSLSDSTPSP